MRAKKLFSSLLAFLLVFTLLTPAFASANTGLNAFKSAPTTESIMQMKSLVAEQQQFLAQKPTLHPDLLKLTGNQEVQVIVHLSEEPVALAEAKSKLSNSFKAFNRANVKKKVKDQQALVKRQLKSKNIKHKEGYSYDTVMNGIAMTVNADELKELLKVEGVVLVEPDVEMVALSDPAQTGNVEVAMSTSNSFLGVDQLWAQGYEGQGIKVGVIDTGIDYTHPEFADNYKGGANFVPHEGTDYARLRSADDPYETTPLDRPAHRAEFDSQGRSFYTSHGSHVAGTIAAKGDNPYNIKGIAPQADIYAYRVLGAYGSGANSWVIAGIERAVADGMDVINLSLGSASNNSTSADAIAINNAMLAGVVAVVSSGNSGPNRGTVGSPGTAAMSITVGNSTNPETQFDATVAVNAGDYVNTSTIALMGWTFGTDLATELPDTYDVVAVPNLGAEEDYVGLDVAGKVALVSRGSIPFVDKIAAAKKAGAKAVLIHNASNGSGAPGPANVFLGDAFEYIPTFDMSYTEGQALRDALAVNDGTVSFSNFNASQTAGDEVNSSSSRGPANPNFDIKPDVVAPGTNIMSSVAAYGKDFPDVSYDRSYERYTGTSMAAPHIAGVAALLKQIHPDWNQFDIKVAISNTAKQLNKDNYDVFDQGPGRVQPVAAANAEALAFGVDTVEFNGATEANLKGTVTFGKLPQAASEAVSVSKEILVKNLSGSSSDYNVSVEVTKNAVGAQAGATVTVDHASFTLTNEQALQVTLNAPQGALTAGNEILGYIHISNGTTKLSLPFAADFSPEAPTSGISAYSLTEYDLSFNGDGVKDEGRLEFTLLSNVATNFVELWDIENPDGGAYEDGYIGYLHAGSSLAAGSYFLTIDGEYTPWEGGGWTAIPEGIYTVDFTGLSAAGVISAWDGPLFVKNSAGEITVEETGDPSDSVYEFTGQVVDKYIDWNSTLALYGLEYDVNTKLATSFEVKDENGNVVNSGPVSLSQNGAFEFEVADLPAGENTLTVFLSDVAGNETEAAVTVVVEGDPEPEVITELTVSQSEVALKTGESTQLSVKYIVTQGEETTETDVSADAQYSGYDENVVSVENGLITAVGVGETAVTVSYEDHTAVVTVNVADVVTKEIVSLDVADLEGQLSNKKPKEVTIAIPNFSGAINEIQIDMSKALVKELVKSKKDLEFTSGNYSVVMPKQVVEKLSKTTDGKLSFNVSIDQHNVNIENALTPTYTFKFIGEKNGVSFDIQKLDKKVDFKFFVDDSLVKGKKDVKVVDVAKGKDIKVKYKQGVVEFDTDTLSSFVVVGESDKKKK